MIQRNLSNFNITKKIPRDILQKVKAFIEGNQCYDGNIFVLYGLRRTGKTTIMEQAFEKFQQNFKCAFYEVEDSDELENIKDILLKEKEKETSIIFIDEITRAKDFISNSSILADVFAKEGIRIIITGTDSLGFQFAEENELYDRTIRCNTTHISYAEHYKILGTKDIDDYIEYGGFLRKGEPENRIVYDYKSACKYLDSAVANNIVNSLKNIPEDQELKVLSTKELQTIIEKMVELYSGVFSTKVMQEDLKKVSVNFPIKKMVNIIDDSIINRILLENKAIIKEFTAKINADTPITHSITESMVKTLEYYLIDMNLVSATRQTDFTYTNELGWREGNTKHEFYVVQPALKFFHLQKGKEFIETEPYYKDLTSLQKQYMQQKLDEKIKGEMMEQIVLYDVFKSLPFSDYEITKPVFYINQQKKGEYDMLIYEKKTNKYWAFEIKHTEHPYILQEQHLQNDWFKEIIDFKYGLRQEACVLYRGDSFISQSGTIYLNVSDFLISIDKYKNVEKTLLTLKDQLRIQKIQEPPMIENQSPVLE